MELTIEKSMQNLLQILHGGTVASLVLDLAESLAVSSSLRGAYSTGVSTDLNVTYISSGVKVGTRSLFSCSFNVMEYILANG
ncbi:hypothetical protein V1524DRAFT_430271 [Lipomyces starkeyi]